MKTADPEGDERVYFRHVREGTRGFLVERDGIKRIKLDRPNEEILLPYREHEWLADREARPLNPHQAARIAFEADKMAMLAFGDHEGARREWLNLSDAQRIAWMKSGPPPGPRADLYRLIMKWSSKYTVK